MEKVVVYYFSRLFNTNGGENIAALLENIAPKVTPEMNEDLMQPTTDKESLRRLQIILHSQTGFVPGRLISDNIIVAAEIAHYMHKRMSGWNGVMALKLDISKAYDRLK
ncbi:hypothetical protein FF1_004140 [Malus domestica]